MAYKLTKTGLNKVNEAKAKILKPDELQEEGKKKSLTYPDIAQRANYSEESVKRFFNPNRGVKDDSFIAILQALNLNIDDLIEGEDYVNDRQFDLEKEKAKIAQENEQAKQQQLIRKQQKNKGETTMVNATIKTQTTEVNVNNSELTFADFRQFLGFSEGLFFFDPKVETAPNDYDHYISVKQEDGTYEIFKPEYQELFFLWLQQDDVSLAEKEEIFEKLIKFDDECECDFVFEIKAYIIAAKSLKYFKTNSFWVNILIDRLVRWAFGEYEKEEKYWGYYKDHLEKGAREALLNTDPNLVIPKLENKLVEISNISDQVRGLNYIVDTIQKYLDLCKKEQENGNYLDHSLSDHQKQLLRDLYNKLSSKNDDNSAQEINLVEHILNLDFEELEESLKYEYVTAYCQVSESENFAYYDMNWWNKFEDQIEDYDDYDHLSFLEELSFEDNTMQLFLEKLYLYDGELSKPLTNTLIEFIKSVIPNTNDEKLINWIIQVLNYVISTLCGFPEYSDNRDYDYAIKIASSHLIFLNQLSKQYPSIEKIIFDFFREVNGQFEGQAFAEKGGLHILDEFFSSCECDVNQTFIKKLAKYYFENLDYWEHNYYRDEVKIAIAENFTDYHEFYELTHNKRKSITTTKSSFSRKTKLNFSQNSPEYINNYLKCNFPFIVNDFQFIYVNTDQIVDHENPALEIYLEMIKSGLPQAQESRPKTLSELKVYWELELKEIKPRPVLVLYSPTSNILPEAVLSQLDRLNQSICLFLSKEQENCPLPQFKEELNEFLKWLLKVKHQMILTD